ncbi:MAG: DUF1015 family protein [Balneolaceae bacterium]
MAIIKPFKAFRPKTSLAKVISSVPYDVVSTQEAFNLTKGKPTNFLHVIRPEIDFPPETDIYDEKVYLKGKENLAELLNSDSFVSEESESLYVYRITWKGLSQTGVFGCVSVKDYDHGIILKHELTRPDKEDDRTKHILTQQAHAEPVMLTFEGNSSISSLIEETTHSKPIFNFVTEDKVEHTIWKKKHYEALVIAFSDIPSFYIADGHHRCASASRAAHEMERNNPNHTGKEAYNFFPAVLFPKNEVNILAYNRVIHSIPIGFLEVLSSQFTLHKNANPIPAKKGTLSLYLNGEWFGLELPESSKNDSASQLDVARLQEFILEPLLNISNQRTDENINFVGGIRGFKELEKLVDSGEAELGISMFPTSIEELIKVSDDKLLMPPKSTWFEPKLRSGLLVHTF